MKPKKESLRRILLALCILSLALAPVRLFGASEDQPQKPTGAANGIIIVDLRQSDMDKAVIYSGFDKAGAAYAQERLAEMSAAMRAWKEKNGSKIPAPITEEAVNSLLLNKECKLIKEQSATGIRWLECAPNVLGVYIIHASGQKSEVTFKEKERETLLQSDFRLLPQILLEILMKEPIAPRGFVPYLAISYACYALKYRQGYLTADIAISAQTKPAGGAAPGTPKEKPTTPAPPASKKENSTLGLQVVTGPKEHFFLSADLLVTKVAKFHYSEGVVEPGGIPSDVYIGLNYMLGDLFLPDHPKKIFGHRGLLDWRYFFGKVMMKLGKRPLDSYGFAVGYRLPNVNVLKNFSIFLAFVRAKDPNVTATSAWKQDLQFGLSFNLDKAVSWLK